MLELPAPKVTADLAIDLGTSAIRVAQRGQGLVFSADSVVATRVSARGTEVVAFGADARKMLGRAPAGISVSQPVRAGVIEDFSAAELLLRAVLQSVGGYRLRGPRVVVCIPPEISEVQRRAVQESTRAAGAREVLLVSSPLCAALGAGIPVDKPSGAMVVDVGAGRTDIGIVSLGGLVVRHSMDVAGDAMDAAIIEHVRNHHALLIGDRTAAMVKERIGAAAVHGPGQSLRIRGRDLPTGGPRELDLNASDIAHALAPLAGALRDAVLKVLAQAPPEIAGDIHDRGILLAGGASRLGALDALLREATGLPVLQAEHGALCAIHGAAALLDQPALFGRVVQGLR